MNYKILILKNDNDSILKTLKKKKGALCAQEDHKIKT